MPCHPTNPKIPIKPAYTHAEVTGQSAAMPPTLQFRKGRFTLQCPYSKFADKLRKDPEWKEAGPCQFETRSLRAAARVQEFADAATQKLLTRTFQAFYTAPPLEYLPAVKRLDPHQRAGLDWILTRKRSYLAHAPGAGKTAQAILAGVVAVDTGPKGQRAQCLLIVPPGLVKNWEREVYQVTRWLDRFPSVGLITAGRSTDAIAWNADFVICADSMLGRGEVYERLAVMPKILIAVDEASRFKDPFSERSLYLYGGVNNGNTYFGLYKDVRHVVFLDGSPMPNRPMELWAPTYALDPQAIDCMDQDDFGYRYCGARPNARGQWEYLWASNEAELQARLRKTFMHVVTEDELTHPERRRTLLYMPTDIRTKEQKEWERKNITEITFDTLKEGMDKGDIATYRKDLGLRKVPFIAKYVRERLAEKNESILLFAWHREVCLGLVERLKEFDPGLVMGGTSDNTREGYFKDFQLGAKRLIIGNISAMGRGHNLQKADRVIFGEYSWTDELNKQCEKRASRRGSVKKFVRCEYIVAPGSMDEIVLRSLFTKEKRVKKVIG